MSGGWGVCVKGLHRVPVEGDRWYMGVYGAARYVRILCRSIRKSRVLGPCIFPPDTKHEETLF